MGEVPMMVEIAIVLPFLCGAVPHVGGGRKIILALSSLPCVLLSCCHVINRGSCHGHLHRRYFSAVKEYEEVSSRGFLLCYGMLKCL